MANGHGHSTRQDRIGQDGRLEWIVALYLALGQVLPITLAVANTMKRVFIMRTHPSKRCRRGASTRVHVYRSKLLNPKWRDAMLAQGSGGAYEISQRMTAMIGWSATAQVDNFVFDQACERYAMDEDVAKQLQRSNPEAFKNVVRRLLEAAGRGMWSTDEDTLDRLRECKIESSSSVNSSRTIESIP
jgi:cobalamin biosynthesis Mg chelatase CobN